MKVADLHKVFESKLGIVKKKGETNFGALYSCWLQILRMYSVPERVQHQLVGYGFRGGAAKVFLSVQADSRPADATPADLWKVMSRKIDNATTVPVQ